MNRTVSILFVLAFTLLLTSNAKAQVPNVINFEASLTDASSISGETTMKFEIYDAVTGGNLLWSEEQVITPVDGSFNVALGSVTSLDGVFAGGGERYLDFVVNELVLEDRYLLASVAYALHAEVADGLSGDALTVDEAGNVGVGTDSPGARLQVAGSGFFGPDAGFLGTNAGAGIRVFYDVGRSDTLGSIFAFDYQTFEAKNLMLQEPGGSVGIGGEPGFFSKFSVANDEGAVFHVLNLPTEGEPDVLMGAWSGGDHYPQIRYETNLSSNFTDIGLDDEGNFFVEPNDGRVLVVRQDGTVHAPAAGFRFPDGTVQTTASGNLNPRFASISLEVEAEPRGALFFAGPGNFDLAVYNNQGDIDGEGVWDGIKLNTFDGLRIRTGEGGTEGISDVVSITRSGNVGIGVTDPGNILEVVQNSATDPIADAWTTYSSKRWKTNIQTIDGALDKVMQLRGVTYDWKESGRADIGLIAEEVGAVVPEVVAFEDNGIDARSVDYPRLVALLIQGMKEQQEIIASQQESIDALVAAVGSSADVATASR